MASWEQKIMKSVGGDLESGEQLLAGVIAQPAGLMRGMMSREIGGMIGAAIAAKVAGADASLVSDRGTAAQFTDGPLVLGVTDRRLIAWTWAKLTGKPKALHGSVPRSLVVDVQTDKKAASHALVIMFADGTGRLYEVPKIGTDVEAFVTALAPRPS
jgi:hypothetical protein